MEALVALLETTTCTASVTETWNVCNNMVDNAPVVMATGRSCNSVIIVDKRQQQRRRQSTVLQGLTDIPTFQQLEDNDDDEDLDDGDAS